MSHWLSVEGIARAYGKRPVFRDVWFGVERGEFVALIGHSGCGKTTILNILAGLEAPEAGSIVMDGREVSGPALDRAVIFQSHALLPWLTALGNVAFAVRSRHRAWSRGKVADHAARVLDLVGLSEAAGRKPAELSGGMKQRVGIARALAIEPQLLLMDEPFSALDALTRGTLQDEVLRLVSDAGQTAFMITHDVDEAILLADRILLMTNGPDARLAEVVVNTLPRPRVRAAIHHTPGYYDLRNHIVDFLVTRSRILAGFRPRGGPGAKFPRYVPPFPFPLQWRCRHERCQDRARPEDRRRQEGEGVDLAAGGREARVFPGLDLCRLFGPDVDDARDGGEDGGAVRPQPRGGRSAGAGAVSRLAADRCADRPADLPVL